MLCFALGSGFLAACGGDDEGEEGGGGGAAAGQGANLTEGAKVIDPNALQNAKGEFTYCVGQDTTGFLPKAVKAFNEKYPNITMKTVEFPASADQQREQFIQRQQ